jgi:hypothetical protein
VATLSRGGSILKGHLRSDEESSGHVTGGIVVAPSSGVVISGSVVAVSRGEARQ